MPQPTNLYDRFDINPSVREDLIDKIYRVTPEKTPVSTGFGKGTATNTYHEWQRDQLAAPNKDNAAIDGDDFEAQALAPTERIGNYCQIFTKKPAVSRRANIVKKAGMGNAMSYQKAKLLIEMRRDIEASVLSNNPAVAGNSTTASKSAGLGCFIYTNVSAVGTTPPHTSGAPLVAPTPGAGRAFTEALLKDVMKLIFVNSSEMPDLAVMSPNHKTQFSAFTGIAANRYQVQKKEQARIIGGADVYMSDFGELTILPHYVMVGATDVFLVNYDYGELAFLDGFRSEQMGKTGDSDKVLMTADVALRIDNEKAFGKVSDLLP